MKNSNLRKNISEYKAVVFDLDGTLYYQRRLRIKMACMLLKHYLCHFWRIKDIFIIKRFREIRENWDEIKTVTGEEKTGGNSGRAGLEDSQYTYTAGLMKESRDRVREVVKTWMYERPLGAVYETRDTELIRIIDDIKKRGQKVYIFSDYPIEDKLKALGISADGMYAATDERLGELKPSPKGLRLIMQDHGYGSDDILMIGDRMSRDGLAAANAGCDYLILPKSPLKRKRLYAESL